jgi:NAD(P)-dependent dehydrogenase (short-subunit alcohol dehydrogenase family)
MQNLNGKRVVITGGSQGLGLAMVESLAACGANVTAIGRDRAKLSVAEQAGAAVVAGDATDATLMNSVVRKEMPDVLILNAGARLPMKPIDQQTWDGLSTTWNTDVKAGLVGIQAALNTPMKPGGRVLVMSSGAAMVLAAPYIAPESLRLSGGYIGAKRMLWFIPQCKRGIARAGPRDPLPGARAMPADSRYSARTSGCGRLRGDRGCQRRRACRATLWLDPAPGAGWRTGRRATRRSALYVRRRLRLSQRKRHLAARRNV